MIQGPTVADLMEVLSGWRLLFNENSSYLSLKSRVRNNKMEEALVTVWERKTGTGRDIQLLIRASSNGRELTDNTWLSASRECRYHFEFSQPSAHSHKVLTPNYGPVLTIWLYSKLTPGGSDCPRSQDQ